MDLHRGILGIVLTTPLYFYSILGLYSRFKELFEDV